MGRPSFIIYHRWPLLLSKAAATLTSTIILRWLLLLAPDEALSAILRSPCAEANRVVARVEVISGYGGHAVGMWLTLLAFVKSGFP